MVVWRHTWPSRHGREGGGRHVLVTASRGVATTFLIDLIGVLSGACSVDATLSAVAFWFPGLRGLTAFWGRTGGDRHDMVATPKGVATWSLSHWADPSHLGGRQFKTEGMYSWCLERGGGGHYDVKAPTGETSQQQQGARRAKETGWERGGLGRRQWEVSLHYLPQRYWSSKQIQSCLLTVVDGAGSRGISRGLHRSESSKAGRRQFATLVACLATSGGIARWGKSSSHNSQYMNNFFNLDVRPTPRVLEEETLPWLLVGCWYGEDLPEPPLLPIQGRSSRYCHRLGVTAILLCTVHGLEGALELMDPTLCPIRITVTRKSRRLKMKKPLQKRCTVIRSVVAAPLLPSLRTANLLSASAEKGLLDAGSSVDTTTECVDTLSQSDKWIS
ncbi:hypothetical protein Taro_000563 [Colocasia esculenta]|uniref:Uncharacterized protein n=1 Tax=Colocasia esculenta TaxID=4460 RepID=A0A843TI45_COLES|nr:hypothetical protein [Colocasia esculenta]